MLSRITLMTLSRFGGISSLPCHALPLMTLSVGLVEYHVVTHYLDDVK